MRKSNILTFLSFALLILLTVFYMNHKEIINAQVVALTDRVLQEFEAFVQTSPEADLPETEMIASETTESENTETETEDEIVEVLPEISTSMDTALFIGDSRTVGLKEYSGMKGPDFFADTGFNSIYVLNSYATISGVGKVKLTTLLDKRDYDKVYIMLGINEAGRETEEIAGKFQEIIDLVQEKEPEAIIIIQANLHVSESRHNSGKVGNNTNINRINNRISQFADGKYIYYIDANVLFDDENGHLKSGLGWDGAHLYAKHYITWGDWIIEQTQAIVEARNAQ